MKILKSFYQKLFVKKIHKNQIDILISLNHKFEIDLVININPDIVNIKSAPLLLSEFLNIINSGKLKNHIINILKNELKDTAFIENLIGYNNIIEELNNNDQYKQSDIFIKPSSVFIKN